MTRRAAMLTSVIIAACALALSAVVRAVLASTGTSETQSSLD